ncbi:MAG: SOS response-associated peptidase family protein [Eubacteriales bacterium]|nr:SOS response-associated peptidase family protein [Eubacteriales bacterium]
MCGRYFVNSEEENAKILAILGELKRRALPMTEQVHGGEIFPSQIAPVILTEPEAGVTVRPMKWGFPRGQGGGGLVINSRSEKADVTPMFQKAARERRCLIPMSGFYEWRRTESGAKTKDKFAFTLADQPGGLMYLAGLYGRFLGGFEEGGFDGFAILTQPADEQMSPYHSRMPVILRDEHAKRAWLTAPAAYAELRALFEPPRLTIAPANTSS